METCLTDRKWIVVRIDGKIAAISTDYRVLTSIMDRLTKKDIIFNEITATATDFDNVWNLHHETKWEDLMLFGTDFQKMVWKKLWELTHGGQEETGTLEETENQKGIKNLEETENQKGIMILGKTQEIIQEQNTEGRTKSNHTRLISYSDFAEICHNKSGVRAVAHALGLNPITVIIPCHLVVPKESIDKISEIKRKAEATIFKGDDLCLNSILRDSSIDFGEYSQGRSMKRDLILMELGTDVL